MHSEPDRFVDATDMIAWLTDHGIRYLPKQLDHAPEKTQFNYNTQQVVWFEGLYNKSLNRAVVTNDTVDLADVGRACCGGRKLCVDQNRQESQKFVTNKFPGWYCSVDKFFLFVKQVNGEVYVNKDCKMNFDGTVGPIGNLSNVNPILEQARDTNRPIIRCAKSKCQCGLCAPKAADLDTYKNIMRKYEIPVDNLL
jgi:hypothetical protein